MIVGAGFSGAVIAQELASYGMPSLVIDSAEHVAGHCYTERDLATGIMLHKFGPHIFNTDDDEVWRYVQRFGEFRPYINRVKARARGEVFSFPINLHTLNQFYRVTMDPDGARRFIESQRATYITWEPRNFEEQALSMIGADLYEAFLRHYTRKQWGRDPIEIPASVLKRLPLRFDYNDNYYNVRYQGIPVDGYTAVVERMLDHPLITVRLGLLYSREMESEFAHTFYTGPVDLYFDYEFGRLSYRTLDFARTDGAGDLQGCAVMNHTDDTVAFTRVSEHKHFAPWETHRNSVLFTETSREAEPGDALYYPVRSAPDLDTLARYQNAAASCDRVTFAGRLAQYRYSDMDDVIRAALDSVRLFICQRG